MKPSIEQACELAANVAEGAGESTSRRALLATGLAAGLAAVGSRAEAQTGGGIHPSTAWKDANTRSIRRIVYGITPKDIADAKVTGFGNWREKMLNKQIDDSAIESAIASRYPRLGMKASALGVLSDDWVTSQHLGEATVMRAAFANNQLFERIVEFWTDHFNIHIDKVGGWLAVPYYRDVIRKHALGSFKDLLSGVCHSPAMLQYLDNTENWWDNGNVNFARELMELHTISVAGGYTPSDIRNVARCFSGWSYAWNPGTPEHGSFAFYDWAHSSMEKTVLGTVIPAGGGLTDGEKVIEILAKHRSTGQHLAKKMGQFFLGFPVADKVINDAAADFQKNNGWIRSMMRTFLYANLLTTAPPKYKRPFHLMVGALRQLQAQMPGDQWAIRYEHLYQAGHLPYNWSTPDGYPDKVDFWMGLILPRWNYALMLPQSYVWNVTVDIASQLGDVSSAEAITNKIDALLFGSEMLPADKADLLKFLQAAPIDDKRKQAAFALALASPSYQWF